MSWHVLKALTRVVTPSKQEKWLHYMRENTVADLLAACRLEEHEVEAVFVNHKGVPLGQTLREGDRVVLIPPGTPGPHRYLLGIAKLPE